MINIGIQKHEALIYEGSGTYGREVWPTPVITPAAFVYSSEDELKAHDSSNPFGYRFREDSFDPVSKIGRGRFYAGGISQPQQCRVSRRPGKPLDSITSDIHGFTKKLETFHSNSIWHKYIKEKRELLVVLLVVDDRYTVWNIISVESISTGEDLLTLRERSSLSIVQSLQGGEGSSPVMTAGWLLLSSSRICLLFTVCN